MCSNAVLWGRFGPHQNIVQRRKRNAMTSSQVELLDSLPMKALSNLVADYASDDIAIMASTFFLAIHPTMADCEPLEIYDWCVAKIRHKLIEKLSTRGTGGA